MIMKMISTIIICTILFSFSIVFAEDWTKEDTYRELTWTALLIMDYSQTMNIARHTDKYQEYNPILGSHPSRSSVNMYMLSAALLHPIISYLLPPKSEKWKYINRENFQYITIGVEIGAVANNIGAGIGVSF